MQIVKYGLYVKAKEGVLKVLEVQGENAKRMDTSDFLRGNKLEVRKKLELGKHKEEGK